MGGVHFDEVNSHIKEEGLDIGLIRILYEGLTPLEAKEILARQGGKITGKSSVLGNYPINLNPMYQEKARGVITLEA